MLTRLAEVFLGENLEADPPEGRGGAVSGAR